MRVRRHSREALLCITTFCSLGLFKSCVFISHNRIMLFNPGYAFK